MILKVSPSISVVVPRSLSMASEALIVMLPSSSIDPKSTSPVETGASLTGLIKNCWLASISRPMLLVIEYESSIKPLKSLGGFRLQVSSPLDSKLPIDVDKFVIDNPKSLESS